MKATQASLGRVFVLRLEDGDVIPDSIERFARENAIHSAFCALLGGVGNGRLVVGPEDGAAKPIVPQLLDFAAVHEAAALGLLAPNEAGEPILHMHMAMGRGDQARVGCARTGVNVWTVAEVLILELADSKLIRRFDSAIGAELLDAEE